MQSNTFFQSAQGVNISGNPNFHNQSIGSVTNVYGGGTDGMQNLNGFISFDAQFDSSAQDPDRQCHPETRQNVLKRLGDWFDNPNSTERISWLHGPAGAGKSAIAQTIARSYSRPKVAGTFFFFRSDVNRNDGHRLFTTLAYQLAFSLPAIRDHIAHFLSERPDLPRTKVETQFEQLLLRPFRVLSDDATQQLAPAVIVDIIKKYQELAPVIIIDGVDECTDENLQRQFLKVIGDAVKDDRFPLRFLIVSRPEVHIEQTIGHFQNPILLIDLAKLDDANRDIKKYLLDEFSRIASEQGLDPTWPGKEIVDLIVYKSSGNFIFAALVIRFVDDPYYLAKTQLEIVLNMKPPKTMSPFAILDQLFLEVLKRVTDQAFLKRYLALLTARISVSSGYGDLHEDDAVLMHVSEEELHANLRRMSSLLKFKPVIDVHHKSFLDFLHDSSRSSEYYIGKQCGIRRYLEVVVDSLVRYVSTVIEKPDHQNAPHFAPRFRAMTKDYPPKIKLPVKEWQEVTQPLLDLQDKLLQLPNFASAWDLLPCNECTPFHLLRELLHLGLHLGFDPDPTFVGAVWARNLRKRKGVISPITDKTAKNKNDKDLDSILLSLFARLPETLQDWSPNRGIIDLMSAVLSFDCAETVMRVRSLSDAHKLVDLLDYVIHAENALRPDARLKASLLALKVFARVPIVPLSHFLNRSDIPYDFTSTNRTFHIEIPSQTLFANRILDHRYINPVSGVNEANSLTMCLWQHMLRTLTSETRIQIMFQLAKAIQYLHSMGVVLDYRQFRLHNVVLDSHLCPKICCLCSTSQSLLDKKCKERFSPHDNIFSFGWLCYELYAGPDTWPDYPISSGRSVIPTRPSEIPENAWQLIQRCCAEDPKRRPTIGEVVKEIEGWYRVGHGTCFGALGVLSDVGRNLCQ
ncbi:hypothetical protein M378DRAFT_169930 [Amanita muscaria Koide BX008]|uniref:NACHT domain-containing protein n=1 Tax=Amanita muscaria (strain Koide BX008) TaxID=946122 RepID=A0A0C2WRM6_AMAMK|nr:hypothetical protein M378DRAFT_169930 [Amanita muscaria Koide BX008]